MRKDAVVAYFKAILRNLLGVTEERKQRNFSPVNRQSGRETKLRFPENEVVKVTKPLSLDVRRHCRSSESDFF
jgi:hypothetical protein